MKNIYFVQANDIYGTEKKNTYIPYATGCIQAYCMSNEIINANYKFGKILYTRQPIDEAMSKIDNPYMVLFSCSVWNTEYNKVLAQKIKEKYPKCYITFGGHSISSDGEMLEKLPYVDFLTHRLGEEPTEGVLVALATGGDLSEVANISYRNENGEIVTTAYEVQKGTDYPSPYLNGVFDDLFEDGIEFSGLLETNRGCPNGCSFCDWSSLKAKVRLFPIERVYAEINWFVDHKIEYIYCTDGNFCLFDRDADIANYLVECKEKYGYPKVAKVFFTKNRFNFVFDVGTKFFQSGLDKAKTISFQSLNPVVLENIGRKNISTEMFRELMKKYNDANISTFSELILGLPGETYETLCEGVCSLIESGQHYAINVYPCELLPNSEMGQKWYKEKYSIKSTRVPFKLIHSNERNTNKGITEYSEYVTSTYSMDEKEWARGLLFTSYVQALHNMGLVRTLAIYFRNEYDFAYNDFYNELISYSMANEGTELNRVVSRIKALCTGVINGENELVATCEGYEDILWGFDELTFLEFYKNLSTFYEEIKAWLGEKFNLTEKEEALFKYQYDIIKKIGYEKVIINSEYDFYNYFKNIFTDDYKELSSQAITLEIEDENPVATLDDFAREVVWYGRNRRASDYTSKNYKVTFKEND